MRIELPSEMIYSIVRYVLPHPPIIPTKNKEGDPFELKLLGWKRKRRLKKRI